MADLSVFLPAANAEAWAIGYRNVRSGKFHIRRVVWGRALARAEKRGAETIRKAFVSICPSDE